MSKQWLCDAMAEPPSMPGAAGGQAGGDMGAQAPSIRPGSRPFKPPSSKRQQITAAEAIDIYKLRPVPGRNRGGGLVCVL